MWWPSPADQPCVEMKGEKTERRAPSLKRHSAWGLDELLTSELPFTSADDKDPAGSSGDVTKASPTTGTDNMVDLDVTSCLDVNHARTGDFCQTTESPVSDLLTTHCST